MRTANARLALLGLLGIWGCGGDGARNAPPPDMALGRVADLAMAAPAPPPAPVPQACPTPTPDKCTTSSASYCTNVMTDDTNCGSCGRVCAAGMKCQAGSCVESCAAGFTSCGTYCASTGVDANNCGRCGNICPSGTACQNGTCSLSCESGYSMCASKSGPVCVNTASDVANCGQCGNACPSGAVCVNGACSISCQAGLSACPAENPDGGVGGLICVDTQRDDQHCGSSCAACAPGSVCQSGACTPCQRVLLFGTNPSYPSTLVNQLLASDKVFCSVDYYDATTVVPPLSFVQQYQSVLVYNENQIPFSDPTGVGNLMASYLEGNGRVVIALFADGGYAIGGNFASRGYFLVKPVQVGYSSDTFSSAVAGDVPVPSSALMAGVQSISGGGWHGGLTLANGGIGVAKWSSSLLLAATGTIADVNNVKHNRADLNIHPSDIASGSWKGDGIKLLHNALLYH